MKLLAPLLTLLIGLGIGIAVGWVLASDETDSAHRVAATQPVEDACDEPTDEPAPLHTNEPGRSETDSTPGGDWTDQLALNVEAAGDSTIRGRVTTGDGSPVPGVWISAAANVPAPEIAADATPQDRLEARAHHLAREVALERTAQTDADGRYEVTGLDGDTYYRLDAELKGYEIKRDGSQLAPYTLPGGEVDFTATAAVEVTLDLRLPDDAPPRFARVAISEDVEAPRSTRYWYWTPVKSARSFEPKNWRLTVSAGEHNEYVADPVSIQLKDGETRAPLTIRLKGRPCIVGRVEPFARAGGARFSVALLVEEGGAFKPALQENTGRRGISERVERIGHGNKFQFNDLDTGNYRLNLMLGGEVVAGKDVTVSDDVVRVVLRPPEPDVQDYIVVKVVGTQGPITERVSISLGKRRTNRNSSGGETVLDRGDGEYWIKREESWFEDDEGWYEVIVHSTHYGQRSERYERTDTHVLEIRFDEPAYVTVHVQGFDEHPERENLQVSIGSPGERFRGTPRAMHRARGDARTNRETRFGPMDPGEYEVALLLNGNTSFDSRVIERRVVQAVSGENRVDLKIPELYSFTVEIPEEYLKRYQVNVHRADNFGHRVTQREKESEFHVKNLKAGEYVIWAGNLGQMRVSLPAMDGRRVRFEPQPFNAYKVTSRRVAEGDDFGLEVGDFVVEMDGNVLAEDFDRRQQWLSESTARESTTWVIVRNGVRMSVTFDGRKYLDSGYQLMPGRVD